MLQDSDRLAVACAFSDLGKPTLSQLAALQVAPDSATSRPVLLNVVHDRAPVALEAVVALCNEVIPLAGLDEQLDIPRFRLPETRDRGRFEGNDVHPGLYRDRVFVQHGRATIDVGHAGRIG